MSGRPELGFAPWREKITFNNKSLNKGVRLIYDTKGGEMSQVP